VKHVAGRTTVVGAVHVVVRDGEHHVFRQKGRDAVHRGRCAIEVATSVLADARDLIAPTILRLRALCEVSEDLDLRALGHLLESLEYRGIERLAVEGLPRHETQSAEAGDQACVCGRGRIFDHLLREQVEELNDGERAGLLAHRSVVLDARIDRRRGGGNGLTGCAERVEPHAILQHADLGELGG